MKSFLYTLLAVALLGVGCGKKDGEATAEGDGGEAAPVVQGKVDPQLQSQLSSVDKNIEQAKYDDAIAALARAKVAAQSEAEQKAYREQLYNAQEALREKAQSDPKALESYQALGRIATGR